MSEIVGPWFDEDGNVEVPGRVTERILRVVFIRCTIEMYGIHLRPNWDNIYQGSPFLEVNVLPFVFTSV